MNHTPPYPIIEDVDNERLLLTFVRKTLAEIAKDTSVPPGYRHPLKPSTISAIRECFSRITEREREIAKRDDHTQNKYPRYADERHTARVVPFMKANKKTGSP